MSTVTIGDRDVVVEEPSIYKTELIGDKLATIGRDVPEIMSDLGKFITRYEQDNVMVLDRHSALTQVPHRVKELSESDWKQLGQKVSFPRSPSGTEQVLAMLPIVFDKAREQALELVALLMISNDDLSRESSGVKTSIDINKEFLRYKAKPSDLIGLLSECTEVVREVIDAHQDELGKLRSFWESLRPGTEAQTEHEAALKEAEAALGASGVSPSSTDSPPDTDGDSERSSMRSESVKPSPSLAS